ncbi:MAG: hypothetical protein JXA73_12010 [Acidobacteria bacterium]|nr:hypothetical protein [Acidobacteriota bacterium]
MISQVGTSGAITQLVSSQTGAYRGSITNTIPVSAGGWPNIPLAGIAAGDFILDGSSQALVLATGSRVAPLIVANPQLPGSSAILYAAESISTEAGTLTSGASVTTGTVGDKQIAVVTGTGTVADGNGGQSPVGNVLVVFDMTNPRQPIPIGFVALDAYGKSATILGGTVFVGTNDHAIMVSLTDPTHPVVSGEIDDFGGRLAVSDVRIIVAADPNLIGVNLAASESTAKILNVTPAVIRVDESGNTINPVEVEVFLSGRKEDFKNSRLKLFKDDSEVASIELGDLELGLHTITFPAGKRMEAPPQAVEVTLIAPDGSQIGPMSMTLNAEDYIDTDQESDLGDEDDPLNNNSAGLKDGSVVLDSLSPSKIHQGSNDTAVIIFGTFAEPPTQIFVRGLDSIWLGIPVTEAANNTAQFTIPASMLSQAGFLEVGFVGGDYDEHSMPLLIFDSALPLLGTLTSVLLERIDVQEQEMLRPETITLTGDGFIEGMRIVLGRGDTPGVILPTEVLDETFLRAQIPIPFAANADDIFAAVLSDDGMSLSTQIHFPRPNLVRPVEPGDAGDSDFVITSIDPGVDPKEAESVTRYRKEELGITSSKGKLKQTLKYESAQQNIPQKLVFQGNILQGTKVVFRRTNDPTDVNYEAELQNFSAIATLGNAESETDLGKALQLIRAEAMIPEFITHRFEYYFKFLSENSKSNNKLSKPQYEPEIPFGGTLEFKVYKGTKEKDYAILTEKEADKTEYKEYEEASEVAISISDAGKNTYDFPLVQIERERVNNKARTYVRGTALSLRPGDTNGTKRKATLKAVVNNKEYTQSVVVMSRKLGNVDNDYDNAINLAADRWSIPPQILKSQALHESAFYKSNYRYEFTSLNLKELSGDGNIPSAYYDGVEKNKMSPWNLYMLGDTVLASYRPNSKDMNDAKISEPFPFDAANPTRKEFKLGQNSANPLNYMIKRTVGKVLDELQNDPRKEAQPFVKTCIVSIAQEKCGSGPFLKLVRGETTWQKAGTMEGAPNDRVAQGISALNADEFSVDYSDAIVKIGMPLQQNQKLIVEHWPVGYQVADNRGIQTVLTIATGDFAKEGVRPDLNSSMIRTQQKLDYNPGEKLFDWLKANRAKRKAFLTTWAAYDTHVEFRDGPNGLEPRDPRYRVITAQPYASSSYGFLQLTLNAFDNTERGTVLKSILDPAMKDQEIYNLLTLPNPNATDPNKMDANFNLAAGFHRATLKRNIVPVCGLEDCTEAKWGMQWIGIVREYNKKKKEYFKGTIVQNGMNNYGPN